MTNTAVASPPAASEMRRPLRILEVGSGFANWGGTEIHLLNLSQQLIARGHDVTISCRPGKYVEKEALRRGLPIVHATVKNQSSFADRRNIRAILKQGDFDVVHVHWSPDYIVTPLLARLEGVPAILMSHHSPHPFKSDFRRWLFRRVLFHKVIALSESVRRLLLSQGMSPELVVTIHHGTDTEAFRRLTRDAVAVRSEWGIPEGAFLVGIVGRVSPEKGIDDFIRAIAALKGAAYGVIVGNPEPDRAAYLDELKRLAISSGADPYLIFAGFRSDVNNAIGSLDALTLASTWAEPCAAVVQQAMALGKPVIGTDIGGTPEMIAAGETGLLVPPGDADALTAAITELADDPEKRRAFGRAGRERVEAMFTQSGMVDRIEALYYQLVEARR